MRGILLSIFAVGALTAASATPAAAYDYLYCAQGRSIGIPGDCSYSSYQQCMVSASGRGLSCNINPRSAFARQAFGQPGYGPPQYYGEPRYRERRSPPRRYRDYY